MKKFSSNLWSVVFALIAFTIGIQMAWAIIQPFIPIVGWGILIALVVWVIVRLRMYYSGKLGGDDSLIRGR